ncbi:MAG TPA: DNA internalization-related competence protein ComEC/Rec2, partial [Ignavibacteriales bacterium]|nr:DNA internalization-related competence protein ComEC/Rec2 [Ignavibacteriales bacterium]
MKDFPVIKIALAFILGIVCQNLFHLPVWELFISIIALSAASLIVAKFIKPNEDFLSIIVLIITITAGALALANKEYKSPDETLNIERIKDVQAFGRISNMELLRNNEVRFSLAMDSLFASGASINKRVSLICSVKDAAIDSAKKLYNKLHIGNYVSASGNYNKGRDKRNPYEFDYRKYLQLNDVDGIIYSYKINDIALINKNVEYVPDFILAVRKSIDEQLKKLHNAESAALIKGLVLGDKGEISYETRTEFINAGIAHILAVSGLHVGYILLIFTFLFSRFNLKLRITSTIIGLILFLLLTGGQPSVFRAVIMASVVLIAQLSGRSANIYNSLALSALSILIINPADLFNAGFQLSFAAVLSIAYFYDFFQKRIAAFNIKPFWLKKLLLFILVSISAQIGTIPLVLIYFGKLSLISIAANIIAIPLAGIIVGVGILTIALSYFSVFIASVYASANELFSWLFLKTAHITGSLKYGYLQVRDFSILDSLIYFLLILPLFLFYNKLKNAAAKIIIISLIFIDLIVLIRLDDVELLPDNRLSIMMIDVGQGDAFLIKFPNGKTALIDAGNSNAYFDNGERVIYPLLNNLGIDKIDYALVSHMDADHTGGFFSLVKRGMVDSVYKPPLDSLDDDDAAFENFLRNYGVNYRYYPHGILSIGGARLYALCDYADSSFNKM